MPLAKARYVPASKSPQWAELRTLHGSWIQRSDSCSVPACPINQLSLLPLSTLFLSDGLLLYNGMQAVRTMARENSPVLLSAIM